MTNRVDHGIPKVPIHGAALSPRFLQLIRPTRPDITAQFWGQLAVVEHDRVGRRVRRNGDRTGPVARTRKHGDRTGQIPVAAAVPVEEPLIDPYDFGFDDVGYGPDPETARRRLDNWNRPSVDGASTSRPSSSS